MIPKDTLIRKPYVCDVVEGHERRDGDLVFVRNEAAVLVWKIVDVRALRPRDVSVVGCTQCDIIDNDGGWDYYPRYHVKNVGYVKKRVHF